MLIALTACKSNTAFTRSMYGLTTKYNILFNGKEAYKQGLDKMEQQEDDYSRRIELHPVYRLVGIKDVQANPDFDRAIDKSKKAIQTRSISNSPRRKENKTQEYREWLNRGEWNPYIHNAWLLSGKAQFYKGDFNAAQATFAYTARHFSWKPQVVAECHIWAARCHAVQGYTYDAEAELNLVIPQKRYNNQKELSKLQEYQNLKLQLQREFSLVQAEILLQKGQSGDALDYLVVAQKSKQTKSQKNRTQFLIAQLYEENGDAAKAYDSYAKVIRSASKYSTQFNARIAQTRVMQQTDIAKAEKKLDNYRRQKRNAEYLDQIHYALGNLALLKKDTTRAIWQYEQAIDKSTRNGLDKAIAALKLGEVTFEREDYVKAQQAYSIAMGLIKQDYPNYNEISSISSVLDELQTYAETIQLQDSLLQLSMLDETELNKVIDRIIADNIKREKEAQRQNDLSEYNNRVEQNEQPADNAFSQPTVGQTDNSWYFYNSALVKAGKTEFQRIWGSRKPEDNWRRKNKTEVILTDNTEEIPSEDQEQATDSTSTEKKTKVETSDANSREFYLAQIPFSDEAKAASNTLIEDGMFNMGKIFNEKMENFPLSIRTFDNLEKRYPDSEHRLDTYYYIYLMYMRMGDKAHAEIYRRKLMETFPESTYAVAVSDPNYIETLRHMAVMEDSLYNETYSAYLANESVKVHANHDWVQENWPLSKLLPKFMFLDALSYVQEGNTESFRDALEKLTALYPSSDVSPLASQMVKGIHEGRHIQSGETAKGMSWKSSLQQAGEGGIVDSTLIFIDNDDIPHVLLLAYHPDSIQQNDLLFEVAKFNFENYLIKDFDLEIISANDLSVLVISKFDTLEDLIEYHDRMDASNSIKLPDGIYMIDISETNFRALLNGRTFDDYFKWVEETYSNVE